jgi:hypothetical protein
VSTRRWRLLRPADRGTDSRCARRPLTQTFSPRAGVTALLVAVALVTLWPEREPVPRLTQVSVRWTSGLPEQERAALERQFSLTEGEPNSNHSADINVWNYALNDLSQQNLRTLVMHPPVVDTSAIDRSRFTVSPQPPGDHPHRCRR